MGLLKKIIRWFTGGSPSPSQPAEEAAPATAGPDVRKVPTPMSSEAVYDEIKRAVSPQEFLHELRSIPPVSKTFERDRKDLEQEVKRLSPPPPPKRPCK
ncbi:MAG: hypothetical protein LHV69_10395 [Elusimicrobia bacterium]|nr:hypothetical protein [Candidatus Obscuribacterium magneticum]